MPVGPEPCGRIVVREADRAGWPRGSGQRTVRVISRRSIAHRPGTSRDPRSPERGSHYLSHGRVAGWSPGRVSPARSRIRADVPRVGDRAKVRGAARWIRRDRQRGPARSRVIAPAGSSRVAAVDAHRVREPSPGPLGRAVDSVAHGPLGSDATPTGAGPQVRDRDPNAAGRHIEERRSGETPALSDPPKGTTGREANRSRWGARIGPQPASGEG